MNQKLLAFYNRLAKGELLNEAECRELAELELLTLRSLNEPVQTETRFEKGLELRAETDTRFPGSPGIIAGRPAKFNNLSHDLGGFKENILPGCFTDTLADKANDIRALVGHDKNRILGRKSAGTLEIRQDEQGLVVDIHCIGTTECRDAYMNIQAGNLEGMSFGFKPTKVKWRREGQTMVRDLVSVQLGEVSVVGCPAYPNTELAARELTKFQTSAPSASVSVLRMRRAALELRYLASDSPSAGYGSVQSQANEASYRAADATRQARTGDEESQDTARKAHEKAAKLHEQAAKASPQHHMSVADEHKAMAKMHAKK